MRHLDLFSGIGGFALAARWMGWKTVGFCEIEPYCRSILRRHWPGVPIHDDIRTFDTAGIDDCGIVTGGFPCQSFSSASAGKCRGKRDDRYLWPEMLRVVTEVDPAWVCVENVPHMDGVALDEVVSDLEAIGYETATLEIPACSVGFDHRRSRLWILGHSDRDGESSLSVDAEMARVSRDQNIRLRMDTADGLPGELVVSDAKKFAALGNAIVPEIAYGLFFAIDQASQRG